MLTTALSWMTDEELLEYSDSHGNDRTVLELELTQRLTRALDRIIELEKDLDDLTDWELTDGNDA